MDAGAVYQDYLALKAHFSGSYNYHKYGGKIRYSTESSGFRRDRLMYMKVAKHPDAHRFLLANALHDSKMYIRQIAYSPEAERIYSEFVARTESLGYLFKQDLKKMQGTLKDNIIDRHTPSIVLLYRSNDIMHETLCIVAQETNILPQWEKMFPYDPVMENEIYKIRKYLPFINYDRARFRKYIADEFADRD